MSSISVSFSLTHLIPNGDWVLVLEHPFESIVVTHPTRHSRRPDVRHLVFLPMPNSTSTPYRSLELLRGRRSWGFADMYEQPDVRRLPRHWDRAGHKHGFYQERETEVGVLETEWSNYVL
ncbi:MULTISPECIES: hypothetical protein [unclassified Crossiella]|uniref:hypothetical protein n=1 Tax=unclassified Crossiella TaxID=2620835 RepID=UPI001FFFFB78|nr:MULTISPECIES: hypothetical protein [unclassified Crossiella]MCK2243740.1 hypothetical protein [Crossiella sp. S99.2]MCK2257599.1 hypothetical protein [Crossiella sp. S99.1]